MKLAVVLLLLAIKLFGQGQMCQPDLFPKQNEKNRYWGYVNFFNEWEVTPIFTKVEPFHGQNAVVLKGTKYGFSPVILLFFQIQALKFYNKI